MAINCKYCQREISTYILSFTPNEKERQLYCNYCHSYQSDSESLICYECNTNYGDFLRTAHLGCAHCYESFAPNLDSLLESYHGEHPGAKAHCPDYTSSRLAIARSQEICSYVMKEQSNPYNQDDRLSNQLYTSKLHHHKKKNKPAKTPCLILTAKSGQSMNDMCQFFRPQEVSKYHQFMDTTIESVRLRIARNIHGLPYLGYLRAEQKKRLQTILLSAKSTLRTELDGRLHLPAKAYGDDEDHLRISWTFNWKNRQQGLNQIMACIQKSEIINHLYKWQFHPDYGFLTACPAISGEGLRLSFQLNIPTLLNSKKWLIWAKNLTKAGYELRGIEDEHSILEDRLQISKRYWPRGLGMIETEATKQELLRFMRVLRSLTKAEFQSKQSSLSTHL